MSTATLFLGLLVGLVNFLFRYLPLRLLEKHQSSGARSGITGQILGSIGIASICALLIVSGLPEIVQHPDKLTPTLIGFVLTIGTFFFTRSIVLSTLVSALGYGVTYKLLMIAALPL